MNNPPGPEHPAFKHGLSRSRAYQMWANMRQRCKNPKSPEYIRYGGRGIKVCERWDSSFLNFYADVGDAPPGKTFDRIDTNGHYEPNNWRWATPLKQAENRRNTILLTHNGRTMSAYAWSKELGITSATMQYRIRRGWSDEHLFTKGPVKWWGR